MTQEQFNIEFKSDQVRSYFSHKFLIDGICYYCSLDKMEYSNFKFYKYCITENEKIIKDIIE